MACHVVIEFACQPRGALGNGDQKAGTYEMINRVSGQRAAARLRAQPPGTAEPSPDQSLTLSVHAQNAPTTSRTLTLAQVETEAAVLEPHVPTCTNCPVNALRVPFGCMTTLETPIPRTTEQWLLDRVQPPDTLGGAMLLQSLEEHPAGTLTPVQQDRAQGLFELQEPLSRSLTDNRFSRAQLSSDEMWVPLWQASHQIAPWQSLVFLLTLGVIKVKDALPVSMDDYLSLARLEGIERARNAKLSLGTASTIPGELQARDLLKTLFVAWARDVNVNIYR